jgi:hypothetical protein
MFAESSALPAHAQRPRNWVLGAMPTVDVLPPAEPRDAWPRPVAASHRFAPALRRHLLVQTGISDLLVERLEAAGLGSIPHLHWCLSAEAVGHPEGLADGLRNRRRALSRALQTWITPVTTPCSAFDHATVRHLDQR